MTRRLAAVAGVIVTAMTAMSRALTPQPVPVSFTSRELPVLSRRVTR